MVSARGLHSKPFFFYTAPESFERHNFNHHGDKFNEFCNT